MGQLASPGADPAVRAHLLAQATDLRSTYVDVALDGGAEFGAYTHTELSKPITALTSGQPYHLRRGDLPRGHPLARTGKVDDWLTLHPDDTLTADDIAVQT